MQGALIWRVSCVGAVSVSRRTTAADVAFDADLTAHSRVGGLYVLSLALHIASLLRSPVSDQLPGASKLNMK